MLKREKSWVSMMLAAVVVFTIAASCGAEVDVGRVPETTSTTEKAEETTTSEAETDPVEESATSDKIDPYTGEPVQLLDLEGTIEVMLANIDDVWGRAATQGWEGYDPNEFPFVLVVHDRDGNAEEIVGLNVADPSILGEGITEIEAPGEYINTAVRVSEPNAEMATSVPEGGQFTFGAIGEGFGIVYDAQRSYAVGDDPEDFRTSYFNPTQHGWAEVGTHELFHFYQIFNWGQSPDQIDQEVYVYSAETIEMAALEDRALLAALAASNDAERDTALRHFVGLRLTRVAAEPTVERDVWQEHIEGAAQFNDRLMAKGNDNWAITENWGEESLIAEIPTDAEAAADMAHGRFYESGAIQIRMLDEMGVDYETELAVPTPPSVALQTTLGVTDAEAAGLADEARATYDPDGELPAQAAVAAEAIAAADE